VWDLSQAGAEPTLELSLTNDDPQNRRSEPRNAFQLLFSPDGNRLLVQDGDRVKCLDIVLRAETLDTPISGLDSYSNRGVIGWLPDGEHIVLFLPPSRDGVPLRLGVLATGGEFRLAEAALRDVDSVSITANVVGDRISVFDAGTNSLRTFGPTLELESTCVLTSHGDKSGVLKVNAVGAVEGETEAARPMAAVLTTDGQQTLSLDEFNARYPSDGAKPDETPATDSATTNTSRTQPNPPAWLGDVEDSLNVEPGEPLSPLALVREPAPQDGAITWTLETGRILEIFRKTTTRP
jgi:hypothetical protein